MADDVVYINVNEGLKRVLNNSKLFAKLLTKFKNETVMQELENDFANNDIEKAKIHSHTLKGLAANLSLTELYKQVVELETQIKAGSLNAEQMALVKSVYIQTLTEADKVIEKYA